MPKPHIDEKDPTEIAKTLTRRERLILVNTALSKAWTEPHESIMPGKYILYSNQYSKTENPVQDAEDFYQAVLAIGRFTQGAGYGFVNGKRDNPYLILSPESYKTAIEVARTAQQVDHVATAKDSLSDIIESRGFANIIGNPTWRFNPYSKRMCLDTTGLADPAKMLRVLQKIIPEIEYQKVGEENLLLEMTTSEFKFAQNVAALCKGAKMAY